GREMDVEDMYHVLSCAFLLMESERAAFSAELASIEKFYKQREPLQKLQLVLLLAGRREEKRVGECFKRWREGASAAREGEERARRRAGEEGEAARRRLDRTAAGARRCLARALAKRAREAFRAWSGLRRAASLERLEAGRAADARKMEVLERDVRELAREREQLRAQLELARAGKREGGIRQMDRFVRAWRSRLLAIALQGWVGFARAGRKRRASMRLFVTRWRKAALYKTLRGWRMYAQDEKRARYVLGKYMQRLANLSCSKVVNAWLDFVGRRRRARGVVQRMVNRSTSGALLSGFLKWASFVAELQHIEDLKNK
ncbi:hypothetical protein TeGR_g13575, partial [Tetraparma gracilis]